MWDKKLIVQDIMWDCIILCQTKCLISQIFLKSLHLIEIPVFNKLSIFHYCVGFCGYLPVGICIIVRV